MEKLRKIEKGRPGSACPEGHLVSNTEFTEKPICTASRQYQKLKIEQFEKMNLSVQAFKEKYNELVKKACICNDLAEAPLIKHAVGNNGVKRFTAICPGPNLAYFSKISTLREMVDHIYGRLNLLNNTYRPNMFIKELKMYVEYFIKEAKKHIVEPSEKQIAYLNEFKQNLMDGIEYYFDLFPQMFQESEDYRERAIEELQMFKKKIEEFISDHSHIFSANPPELVPA